jgi:hypothetical protein
MTIPIREQSALELMETHAKALEAEIERLRAALEWYAKGPTSGGVAREALRSADESPPPAV